MTQPPENTELSLKNRVRAKKITEGLLENKTFTQIAKELEISRNTLYATMDKEQVQQMMILEIREHETRALEWIMELHNSPSPANQRTALQEYLKHIKHVMDKGFPSIFRTENININLDLTNLQQQNQLHQETIRRLPPSHRQLYQQTQQQIRQEWGLNQPT